LFICCFVIAACCYCWCYYLVVAVAVAVAVAVTIIIVVVVTMFMVFFNHLFRYSAEPDDVLLILHETPGTRFSMIPGDYLSHGSKLVKIKLGEYAMLGIHKIVRKYDVQRKHGVCKEYEKNDSQAKCNIDKVISKALNKKICDETENLTMCSIPQAKDILEILNKVNTTSRRSCMTFKILHCIVADRYAPMYNN
jgi:hypothetical protein